ncbi:hypothetical protein DASC09_063100 [Saccharomycopsis crataegensis]|uniref:CCHC-type domain-containing protein n=1 Tax=Saccharomycopsis crataegensis TaxID=43959 RepID=A0AAV5QWU2_9ASCO|nr:hypothetical protein DASC09_063100 [Saccharomycopsis crataegensis]
MIFRECYSPEEIMDIDRFIRELKRTNKMVFTEEIKNKLRLEMRIDDPKYAENILEYMTYDEKFNRPLAFEELLFTICDIPENILYSGDLRSRKPSDIYELIDEIENLKTRYDTTKIINVVSKRKNSKPVKCYRCEKYGHFAVACKRKNQYNQFNNHNHRINKSFDVGKNRNRQSQRYNQQEGNINNQNRSFYRNNQGNAYQNNSLRGMSLRLPWKYSQKSKHNTR